MVGDSILITDMLPIILKLLFQLHTILIIFLKDNNTNVVISFNFITSSHNMVRYKYRQKVLGDSSTLSARI